jgi:hypothetical protein
MVQRDPRQVAVFVVAITNKAEKPVNGYDPSLVGSKAAAT